MSLTNPLFHSSVKLLGTIAGRRHCPIYPCGDVWSHHVREQIEKLHRTIFVQDRQTPLTPEQEFALELIKEFPDAHYAALEIHNNLSAVLKLRNGDDPRKTLRSLRAFIRQINRAQQEVVKGQNKLIRKLRACEKRKSRTS